MGMGGIRELLDGKIWEWDLSFRWEWERDGNGNEVVEMGRNWYEKSVPAHLYHVGQGRRNGGLPSPRRSMFRYSSGHRTNRQALKPFHE